MQIRSGYGGRHPLVVRKKRDQRLASCFWIFLICPICVHELYCLSQGIFSFWIAIQVIDEIGHGEFKVISSNTVLAVHDTVHKFIALALVYPEHDIVVQKLALLHQDLWVIWHNISIDYGSKSDVVLGRSYVLLDELFVVLILEALDHFHRVVLVAPHLLGQHSRVFGWLVVNGPARQRRTTLNDCLLEQIWRTDTKELRRIEPSHGKCYKYQI